MKSILIIALSWMGVQYLQAQDYDADSVFYSPISKVDGNDRGGKNAEVEQHGHVSYFLTMQTGALAGCKNCSFTYEVSFSTALIQGVTIGKKLRVGAGVGFDTYRDWQTLPIFGSASWDLFGNKDRNALYFQFGYGWSKPWSSRSVFPIYQDVSGGRVVSTQVGYRISYHDLRITFGIGTKYQRVRATSSYPSYYYDFRGMPIGTNPNTTTLREGLNRLSIVMGIGWK